MHPSLTLSSKRFGTKKVVSCPVTGDADLEIKTLPISPYSGILSKSRQLDHGCKHFARNGYHYTLDDD